MAICKWCGGVPQDKKADECDGCYEMRWPIDAFPDRAAEMLDKRPMDSHFLTLCKPIISKLPVVIPVTTGEIGDAEQSD